MVLDVFLALGIPILPDHTSGNTGNQSHSYFSNNVGHYIIPYTQFIPQSVSPTIMSTSPSQSLQKTPSNYTQKTEKTEKKYFFFSGKKRKKEKFLMHFRRQFIDFVG
eukprot:TRINITY_DN1387_c0_g1_i1.p1 TRINITY_DN1387_c0_g1~~TRINITY_DN1387_c0_g1_i1.p1  ORF type:complete len:107 (-),score=8.79 TRINITY_DN1387_c0_g1_i1:30-350(-)